jgi:hypothetical protein
MSVDPGKEKSKRFESRGAARWLIPTLLVLLTLGILLTLVVTVLSILGLTPGM